MKPLIKTILYIPVCWLLLSSGCTKTETPSPADPFANLNNQLVCKINGVEWKSTERGGGFYHISGSGHHYIYLGFGSGWQSINFFINPPYDKPYYILNKNTTTFGCNLYPKNYISFSRWYPGFTPSELYVTNETDTGRLDIVLLDSYSNYIKGKFFFTGRDSRTGKKITVTDGYFHYYHPK